MAKAHELVCLIYKTTDKFPAKDAFGIASQMQRASISVTSNIAEGFGRQHPKDKLHFYVMARASLIELENQIIACRDIGRIPNNVFSELMDLLLNSQRLLNGLIRSTKKNQPKAGS